MIEASALTKRFGQVVAVDGLTFSVRPGEVTGFLGRNGAGKTTTLRMILGPERPTSGTVTVDGQPYADLVAPLRHLGSLLDAQAVQRLAAAPPSICSRSRGAMASTAAGWPRFSRPSGSARSQGSGREACRWACSSASGSPGALLGDSRSSCSTSPSTGSTPKASSGSAVSCARWPRRGGPSSSQVIS